MSDDLRATEENAAKLLSDVAFKVADAVSTECELFIGLIGPENIKELRTGAGPFCWDVIGTDGAILMSTRMEDGEVSFTVRNEGDGKVYLQLTGAERRLIYGVVCFARWASELEKS